MAGPTGFIGRERELTRLLAVPVSEPAPGQPPAFRAHNISAFVVLPKVLRWFLAIR